MISIDLGEIEYFDDVKKEFVYKKGGIVKFEYSLRAVYEWEGRWSKPFINSEHTEDELMDFYMLMSEEEIDEEFLTVDITNTLARYIGESHTATKFGSVESQNGSKLGRGKATTSEEIYALMSEAGIPLEFENRNLNRLLVILRIISSKNNPPKKMSKDDIFKQNASLNAQRKAMMNSRG